MARKKGPHQHSQSPEVFEVAVGASGDAQLVERSSFEALVLLLFLYAEAARV
jgi:hypothetical protein